MERKMMEAAEQGKPLPDIPGLESVKEEILSRNSTLAKAHQANPGKVTDGNAKV